MELIAKALVKAQSEMSNPTKGANNPFFKSKYADLNAVREAVIHVLNENGIVVLQPMTMIDGKNYIKTVLLHESGQMIDSYTEIVYSKQNDAQAQGSGITYARRYGLQSLVCVGADDDDGNKASKPQAQPQAPVRNPKLNEATEEIKKAENEEALKIVWTKWVELQKDNTFITAVNMRKAEITKK